MDSERSANSRKGGADASLEIEPLEQKLEDSADVELEELRRGRRALSKMNQGIENVQHQMKYFNSNVSQTTQLLDIWVRVLSQTAHNQVFVSNEEWQGGGMDSAKLGDLVQRDRQQQEEAERKIRDAEQKRDRERAEARDRERKMAELAAAAVAASASEAGAATQNRPPTRPGLAHGRRPPPGGLSRGAGAATSARGGRGRGSGGSIIPAPGSRIRPPR